MSGKEMMDDRGRSQVLCYRTLISTLPRNTTRYLILVKTEPYYVPFGKGIINPSFHVAVGRGHERYRKQM